MNWRSLPMGSGVRQPIWPFSPRSGKAASKLVNLVLIDAAKDAVEVREADPGLSLQGTTTQLTRECHSSFIVAGRYFCGKKAVDCSITVKDDLIGALGIDPNVTDTFPVAGVDGEFVRVASSSNDPQAYWDAEAQVRANRADLIDRPCEGFFDGGPTPGDCVRAMVRGHAEYASVAAAPGDSNKTWGGQNFNYATSLILRFATAGCRITRLSRVKSN
jgi:hypothetical protein